MRILVLNAGSSTLKASVLEWPTREPLVAATVDWGADATKAAGRVDDLRRLLTRFAAAGVATESIGAVGHRVVHGGIRFVAPVVVDDQILAALEELSVLAPLHNPVARETITAARVALPGVPHVAAFDTAFHATIPPAGYRYPLPEAWYRDWGIRRYGFHGLSVAWSTQRAAELLGRPAESLGLVVAHLGSGCSVTAVDGGRSVDTSMGMTPLEGLMMGTRAGSIDPGILLAVLRDGRVDVHTLADTLDHQSGLLGVSGATSDMRELLAAEAAGDERAELALELFVRRAAAGIASASTTLRHLDALVFTAGIGQHAGLIRARVVERLAVLGIPRIGASVVDEDTLLSPAGTSPAVLRIEAREDLVVAREAEGLLRRPDPQERPNSG